MYKKPEVSAMARQYKKQLKEEFGITVSHSQALNYIAKLLGVRDYATLIAIAPKSDSVTLFEGQVKDWMPIDSIKEDVEQEKHRLQTYSSKVSMTGDQLFIEMNRLSSINKETPSGLAACVDVDNGLPCVHIANREFDDYAITIVSTDDGLYLRLNSEDLVISAGTPHKEELAKVHEREIRSNGLLSAACNRYLEL